MSPHRDAVARPAGVRLCLSLTAYAFLINLKPSEPFLTDYLLRTKNFTEAELAVNVWPWSTFGAVALLIPFGLLAEVLGSRVVILMGMICREATRAMLLYGTTVPEMALMQFAYGAGLAANAIFFAYMYAVSPPSAYAPLTSMVMAAFHAGNVLGASLGQGLVWARPGWHEDSTPLFYLSWAFVSLGFVAFAFLPPPNRALPPSLASLLMASKPRESLAELDALWRPRESRLWLSWFLFAGAGSTVVGNFFQLQLAQTAAADVPYGALEAAIELGHVLGAACAVLAASTVVHRPAGFLVATSLARAAALSLAALGADAGLAWIAFASNVAAAAVYGFQQAAGSSALAQAVVASVDRPSVLFSANTLVLYAGAAVLSGAGAAADWEAANTYYYWSASLLIVLAACAPFVRAGGSAVDMQPLRPALSPSSSSEIAADAAAFGMDGGGSGDTAGR